MRRVEGIWGDGCLSMYVSNWRDTTRCTGPGGGAASCDWKGGRCWSGNERPKGLSPRVGQEGKQPNK